VRRKPLSISALLLAAISLASCEQNDVPADAASFLSNSVVPVGAGFNQAAADTILAECGATGSAIRLLDPGMVRFEPSPDSSVNTAACVMDRLISSGQPPIEDFDLPPGTAEPEPIG